MWHLRACYVVALELTLLCWIAVNRSRWWQICVVPHKQIINYRILTQTCYVLARVIQIIHGLYFGSVLPSDDHFLPTMWFVKKLSSPNQNHSRNDLNSKSEIACVEVISNHFFWFVILIWNPLISNHSHHWREDWSGVNSGAKINMYVYKMHF